MGRPKRLYPLGKYRLRIPKEYDKNKAYPIELEYTWNRQIIRKTVSDITVDGYIQNDPSMPIISFFLNATRQQFLRDADGFFYFGV